MNRPSEIRLDLHAVVDKLLLVKADLQAYAGMRGGDGDLHEARRHQLAFAIRQVSERALALEDLAMRLGGSVLAVTVTRATGESLRCAVHRIDRLESIDDAEPFDDVVSSVIDILHAADVVCLRASGGRLDAATRRDVRVDLLARTDGSRTGVVVARIGPCPPACADDADDRSVRSVGR